MAFVDKTMADAMRALGWDPDSDFPMANAENIQLLAEIEELNKEKQRLQELNEAESERLKKIDSHVKIAKNSVEHNMKLLNAYQMEAIEESHKCKLVHREHSKIKEDIKGISKENENMKSFVTKMDNEISKLHKKMEKETSRINWAKNALAEWQQAMDEGKKGYDLIEKYFKVDQQKALEADQKRKVLQNEINKVRQEVIRMYDEQKTLEQAMESIATLYRNAHKERRQLVDTWKAACRLMNDRERLIIQGEANLVKFQEKLHKNQEKQKGLDQGLNDIIQSNRDIEHEIEDLNKETSFMRDDLQRTIDLIKVKEQEIDILERDLQNLAHVIEQQRLQNKRLTQARLDKMAEIAKMVEANKKLECRTLKFEAQNLNAQQRLQMLEDLIDNEEKVQKELTKETVQVNQLLFRAQQKQAELISEEKIQQVLNDSLKSTIGTVARKILDLEKDLQRMSESNYELGFKVLDRERELIRLKGGVIDPEEERRNQAYLAELEEELTKLQKTLRITENENKKLDNNMRELTAVYNRDMKQFEDLKFNVKQAESYCEGGIKRLNSERNQYQSMIVELSILKMRANEFENEISETEDRVYNLERHRLHLNKIIKDRMVEIKSQMELLNMKKKHLNEERSTLRADIGERKKHIEAMRARFELAAHLLGQNEDGTLITATQLRVCNAQEKQMLLEEGNQLNERVIKAEKEIKAMENTVNLIHRSNDQYKGKVLVKDKQEEATAAALKELQLEHCKAVETLKVLRQQAEKTLKLINKTADQKEKLERTLETEKEKKMEFLEALAKVQKEIEDQKAKIQRAEKELANAYRNAQHLPLGPEFLALYDKNLDLRDIENRNVKALNQLCDLVEHEEEYGPRMMEMMIKRGFKMSHQVKRSRSYGLSSMTSELSFPSSRSVGEDEGYTDRSTLSGESLNLKSASISVISLDFPSKKK